MIGESCIQTSGRTGKAGFHGTHYKDRVADADAPAGRVVVSYPAETVPASNTSDAACVVTELQYRSLSDQEINTYIGIDNPLDTAGAFKIESHGLALFSRVTSDDPSALIGLPLIATMRMLRAAGLDPLQQNHRA